MKVSESMKVLTDLTGESPEVDIDFANGTKVSIYRSPFDGEIKIFVDMDLNNTIDDEDRPEVSYGLGYR